MRRGERNLKICKFVSRGKKGVLFYPSAAHRSAHFLLFTRPGAGAADDAALATPRLSVSAGLIFFPLQQRRDPRGTPLSLFDVCNGQLALPLPPMKKLLRNGYSFPPHMRAHRHPTPLLLISTCESSATLFCDNQFVDPSPLSSNPRTSSY